MPYPDNHAPAQTITAYEAPGSGTALGQGTQGGVNNKGETITGSYAGSSGVNHGFKRSRRHAGVRFA